MMHGMPVRNNDMEDEITQQTTYLTLFEIARLESCTCSLVEQLLREAHNVAMTGLIVRACGNGYGRNANQGRVKELAKLNINTTRRSDILTGVGQPQLRYLPSPGF